jgi:RNA polymerase primary sigma factor
MHMTAKKTDAAANSTKASKPAQSSAPAAGSAELKKPAVSKTAAASSTAVAKSEAKAEKAANAPAPAKADKAAKPLKADKPEQAVKPAKPGKDAKDSKDAKAVKPGKAGKSEPKSEAKAKPALEEDDVSDVEADFEGGEEAEAVESVEVEEVEAEKVKAKPLRMKVSRAKERALMREFGLEETTLTEEEVAKRRQELKTLIKMGKTRGFLTHQEINDHLPEKLVNEEILEAIISMLNDMGIAVYEQAPDAATMLISGSNTGTATDEEAE